MQTNIKTESQTDKIIYYIIVFNLLIDITTDIIFQKGGPISFIRAAVLLVYIFYVITKYKIKHAVLTPFYVFTLYVIILIPFSSLWLYSLQVSLKVIISLLMFPIAFMLIDSADKLKKLNKSIVLTLFLLLLNFILGNYFDIGTDVYSGSDDFSAGNLYDAWNTSTYSLLLVPLILYGVRKVYFRSIVFTLAVSDLFILIFSMKRIAMSGIILGFLILTFLNRKKSKSLKIVLSFLLVLLFTYPLYATFLNERLKVRTGKFDTSELLEETRYVETQYVWEEIFKFQDPVKVLFGLQAFNSVNNYGNGIFGRRGIHVDYNLIANTLGIIGLILYLNIYRVLFKNFMHLKYNSLHENHYDKFIKSVAITILILSLYTSLAGQMYGITFRSIIFLYCGAILRLLLNKEEVLKK